MILENSHNATSSLESADGVLPLDLPESQTTSQFILGAVRASRFLSQDKNNERKESKTNATCGHSLETLSASVRLQSLLENRLRQLLPIIGSISWRTTWKTLATPAGRPLFLLRASVRLTCEADSIGPGYSMSWYMDLPKSNWRTPAVTDSVGGIPLQAINDPENFNSMVKNEYLVRRAYGATPNGEPARTGSSARMNPSHSRWLMGYPPEWDVCAVMAMQSSHK